MQMRCVVWKCVVEIIPKFFNAHVLCRLDLGCGDTEKNKQEFIRDGLNLKKVLVLVLRSKFAYKSSKKLASGVLAQITSLISTYYQRYRIKAKF